MCVCLLRVGTLPFWKWVELEAEIEAPLWGSPYFNTCPLTIDSLRNGTKKSTEGAFSKEVLMEGLRSNLSGG